MKGFHPDNIPLQLNFINIIASYFSFFTLFLFILNLFLTCKQVLHPFADSININKKVWDVYFSDLIPRLVEEGDDGNCGSTAVCDAMCLQVCILVNLSL